MSADYKGVIFFDGHCGLCNGFVDFVIKRDTERKFRFATLQGELARRQLPHFKDLPDSVIYLQCGQILYKSDAALTILYQLPNFWYLTAFGFVFPRFFRDGVYDLIAANRYKWFGHREQCRIPSSEEKQWFLD